MDVDHPNSLMLSPKEYEEISQKLKFSQPAYRTGRKSFKFDADWPMLGARFMALYGVALWLAGIICFFAYNWETITSLIKFGAIEAGLVVTLIGAFMAPRGHWIEKIFLTCAFVLVGTFMAVFGQIYQTGADAWQLFANWAMLGGGLVLVARSSGLWLLWLGVFLLAIVLYLDQNLYNTRYAEIWQGVAIGGASLCFLLIREVLCGRGFPDLASGWTRYIPIILIGGAMVFINFIILFTDQFGLTEAFFVSPQSWEPAFFGIIILMLGHYVFRQKDLKAASLSVVYVSIMIFQDFLERFRTESFTTELLATAVGLVLVLTVASVVVIKMIGRRHQKEQEAA